MSSTKTTKVSRGKLSDLVGERFGRLVVLEYLGPGKWGKHRWLCECDCGNRISITTSGLTGTQKTLSCGCLRKETLLMNRADPTKHGLHKHKLYSVHKQMIQRCQNPNAQRWKYYGGKGISVCKEWYDFLKFYNWALSSGYREGLSIDRIDNNKDYEPDNCQWITVSENTKRAHIGKSRGALQTN